ncbi:Hemolysin III family protein [Spraguea lophii 42_110]|uniref:Hemolysin III family protein n=1 Tax=Spraguea lophii (strain 42_110) TaxID=1358809 RepID=S7XKK0_SPRLO|nr:Hemolysin III family protein [Spraguea lophii 42_110]
MEMKPKLRGRLHQFAFYYCCTLFFIFLLLSILRTFKWTVCLYLLSQMILFGFSSSYHIIKWKSTKAERIAQRLDHASIFILISGTQTSTILSVIPSIDGLVKKFIIFSWTLSLIGVTKVFILDNIYEIFDIILYTFHGLSVVVIYRYIVKYFNFTYILLIILGGILYIIGGVLFGCRIPEITPGVFGYHEFWHALTILANGCFGVPILVEYIKSLKN